MASLWSFHKNCHLSWYFGLLCKFEWIFGTTCTSQIKNKNDRISKGADDACLSQSFFFSKWKIFICFLWTISGPLLLIFYGFPKVNFKIIQMASSVFYISSATGAVNYFIFLINLIRIRRFLNFFGELEQIDSLLPCRNDNVRRAFLCLFVLFKTDLFVYTFAAVKIMRDLYPLCGAFLNAIMIMHILNGGFSQVLSYLVSVAFVRDKFKVLAKVANKALRTKDVLLLRRCRELNLVLRRLCDKINDLYGHTITFNVLFKAMNTCFVVLFIYSQSRLGEAYIPSTVLNVLALMNIFEIIFLFGVPHLTAKEAKLEDVFVSFFETSGDAALELARLRTEIESHEVKFTADDLVTLDMPSLRENFEFFVTMIVWTIQFGAGDAK